VVKLLDGGLLQDHLYIRPEFQGQGLGAAALRVVFAVADVECLPVRVGALRGSRSNQFYLRHGVTQVDQGEFDVYYVHDSASEL
jgi:GNAT superfamily N-acetyltransferase